MIIQICPVLLGLLLGYFSIPGNGRTINEVMRVDSTTFNTGSELHYEQQYFTMLERNYITFRVRACSDAHVGLLQMATDLNLAITEIIIGGWSNGKSAILQGMRGPFLIWVDTPNLLNCGDYRTFWVSWRYDRLEVGKGATVGQQIFMSVPRTGEFAHRIRDVGFSTGFGQSGQWEVEENQAYYSSFWTPDRVNFEQVWKTIDRKNSYFRFRVKVCQDGQLALGIERGRILYHIIFDTFGDEKTACIYFGGSEKACTPNYQILDCNLYVPLWVSWKGGLIKFGKGENIDENIVVQWQDPDFRGIGAIGFTSGYGWTADWYFEENMENRYTIYSTPSTGSLTEYNSFVHVPRVRFITFQLRAATDAIVAMTKDPGFASGDFVFYLHIGTDGNTKTKIFDGAAPNPVVTVDTVGILSNQETRAFWLSWENNLIEFGRGVAFRENVVAQWQTPVYYVNSIAFANKHENGAFWVVRKNAGDAFVIQSKTDNAAYKPVWVEIAQEYFKCFRVMACSDVYVLLAATQQVSAMEAYEVIIGYQGSKTIIRDKETGITVAEASDSGSLDCNQYKTFWVSWLERIVRVGRGYQYGKQEIVASTEPKPDHVYALSFSSTHTTGGVFEIESDHGDYQVESVSTTDFGQKWFHLSRRVNWFYFKVSGNTARMLLSPSYGEGQSGYEVLFDSSKKAYLKKDGMTLGTIDITGKLDATELRAFWVSWENGLIQLGEGIWRDVAVLLAYTDGSPYAVRSAAVASGDNTLTNWKLYHFDGVETIFDTASTQNFNQFWMSLTHRTNVIFALKVCEWAHIQLTSAMHNDDHAYWIRLQDGIGNSSIWGRYITESGNAYQEKVQRITPNLFSCSEERFYWLTWASGHIAIGQGKMIGQSLIVAYQDLNPYPVKAMSISTERSVGVWRFPLASDDFQTFPPTDNGDLDGGEITAVVFGFLALFGLFGLALYVIWKPPEQLKPIFYATSTQSSTAATTAPMPGFDNPLHSFDSKDGASSSKTS